MIKTKNDLAIYLKEDKTALGRKRRKPKYNDYIWKYEITLRKAEFYFNNKNSLFKRLMYYYHKYKLSKLSVKTGFFIGINSVGKGLNIAHIGPIIINGHVKIGDYCRIHVGVNIGTAAGYSDKTPVIGNHVYIGPGAKIFGNIKIGDGVAIGANAVVNKSFPDKCSIAGVPAKIINEKGSFGLCYDRRSDL